MNSNNMTNRTLRIAIIGAGIGGLTAAAALHQRGFEVVVHERAPQLGEIGAGLQMAPNAVKVVCALGLEARFLALGAEPSVRLSLNWNDGSLRAREQMKGSMEQTYGARYCTVHRADLHRLLLSCLPASAVRTGVACVGAQTSGNVAVARFADGSEVEADLVIGADGIHSAVRTGLFGDIPAKFTNQVCWRMILPMAELAALADRMPVPLDGSEYTGWLGPTGHVIFYPLRGGELLNIVAGHHTTEWTEESWSVRSTVEEMLAAYAGWNDGLLAVFARAQETYKWGIYDREPLPRWVDGRVTLLGDAAHPMMPTLAQGAAISMEDGVALARHIGDSSGDAQAALAAYERERQPRASQVQLQARQQFRNNLQVPAPPPMPVDWIYGHDAVTGTAASVQTARA
jgi:salicylate hydroxylase